MNINYIEEINEETLKLIKIVPVEPLIYKILAGCQLDIQERTENHPKLWYGIRDFRTDPVTVEILTTNKEMDDWQSLYGAKSTGAQGSRGYQGFQGVRGEIGPRGYQGFQGFQGTQGQLAGFNYKGQLSTINQLLQISDAEIGDCYFVLETNSLYCYAE